MSGERREGLGLQEAEGRVTPLRSLYAAEKYTYHVVWSDADAACVGRCSEFPSLSHLSPGPFTALAGIITLVRGVLRDMHAANEQPPQPLALVYLLPKKPVT